MSIRKRMAASIIVVGLVGLFITGCSTGGNVTLPAPPPDNIKVTKQISVWAHNSSVKKTGVFLEKGDLFSVMITGRVNTSPRKNPNLWSGPYDRLEMMIGHDYYGGTPINRTLESDHSGEIMFYVRDGDFDRKKGKAIHPEWYNDNRGKFEAVLIIWKNKEWEQISKFFREIEALNPENEAVRRASGQAETYKNFYLAKMTTVKDVERTKEQISSLKASSAADRDPSAKTFPDAMGSSALAATEKAEGKEGEIAVLETKLATLMATLAQLEEIKKELAAEREKSTRLSEELEATNRQGSSAEYDQYPPLILIASPKDGQETSDASVMLAGVIEDNQGLKEIEVYINERRLSPDQARGLTVIAAEPIKRHEFNEAIPVQKGVNRIRIRATDTSGRVTEKELVVLREEQSHTIWAVVIGIDTYPRIPKLKYAVKDAQAFYQLLVEHNRIPAEKIIFITNEQASLTNLRSALGTKLKQNAGRDDMVIIYFAGHGATERDAMSPDGDGLEKYILPYDANPQDLYATALPMREISHILNRIQSERLVFIADACYSGASGGRTVGVEGFRANISDGFLSRIARGKGRVIITASGANEVSAENDQLQHGVFTYYLIEGLKGRADYDNDGLITVDEAYRYVSDTVPGATAQEQHPIKKGAVEGHLVLGIVNDNQRVPVSE